MEYSHIQDKGLRNKLIKARKEKQNAFNKRTNLNSQDKKDTSLSISTQLDLASKNKDRSLESDDKERKKLKKPPTKSLAISTKQLASMVRTGLPIVEAMNLVAETSDNKSIEIAFKNIANGISKGSTIVEMLMLYPNIFDDMYVALLSAGEQAGLLSDVLNREAKLLETLAKLNGQIKSALAYPIAILILVTIVVVIMLIYVIPVFVDIYESSGTDLPGLTQALVDVSNWIRQPLNVALLIGGGFACFYLFGLLSKNKKFMYAKDSLYLKLPIVKDLVAKSCLANFSRTLSSLNSAGVPLLESITISKRTLGNLVYVDIINRMYKSIQGGEQIHYSLSREKMIPKMFSSMFKIGEETGELSEMVDKLADFYEEEVSMSVKSLTAVMEPMMIVVVAGVVAVILIAMYLPMFNMMDTVK